MLSSTTAAPAVTPVSVRTAASSLPWYLVVLGVAVFFSTIGGPWDISWHLTIGRDTFWTPAHMAIYLGGASAGITCGWLAIKTTFLTEPAERRGALGLWGGYAPFGAWVVIWGAVAMLTAGPFDDWWHNAYGLDVKIISPPHVLLFAGGGGIRLGAWLLVLRQQNREQSRAAAWLVCLLGGLALEELAVVFMVELWPNREHSAAYLLLTATVFPGLLAAIARASPLRWAATLAAGSYMLVACGLTWILPLFAAEPKLGPIYHHVSHMVAPPFPQWVILPALAIDLLKGRIGTERSWRGDVIFAVTVAAVFLALFWPAQWFFAKFYLSPAADNWFFAGNRIWGYSNAPAGTPHLQEFWDSIGRPGRVILEGGVLAALTALLGRWTGWWMSEVKR